jgi:hypothetical protein
MEDGNFEMLRAKQLAVESIVLHGGDNVPRIVSTT